MKNQTTILKRYGGLAMKLNKYSKKLTVKFIKHLLLILLVYTIGFFFLYYIFQRICSLITWYPEDDIYILFSTIAYNQTIMFFIYLIGVVIIFIFLLMKSLSYIDQIIDQSRILIEENDKEVSLPDDLKEVEIKMNNLKKESQKNLKLAKENEQKKNDLLVYLAHDIKTPLTSVIGYLSILKDEKTLSLKQQKKFVSIALNKSYKLENLVNELFEITKYNSNTIEITKEPINLTMLLDQIIDEFYPTLKKQNKKVIFHHKENFKINGDSDKLARAFNNIIKNAINYSYKNTEIKIEIKEENYNIKTEITNQGDTIPQDDINKIFEKFYRADSSRNSRTGGTGLGLAIAKEIITLHGGNITVQSENNQTTFKIILPK